jgi:hypothetical protein
MIKYAKTSKYIVDGSEGFITHEDQEVNGLSFTVLFEHDGEQYVKVEGEEVHINAWKDRIEGTFVTEEEVTTIEGQLPVEEPIA